MAFKTLNCSVLKGETKFWNFYQNWLEKEVKLMSVRDDCEYNSEYDDDYTCPLCCVVVKYILVAALVIFFTIIPSLMIYVGVSYRYCQDIFSAWLLAGLLNVCCKVFLFIHSFDINIVALGKIPTEKYYYQDWKEIIMQ